MKKINLMFIIFGLIAFAATTMAFTDKADISSAATTSTVASPDDPADAKYPAGAKIYKEKCVACHQLTGLGIPGAFPPLKGSDYLFADKKRAIAQVLNGSNEPIVVNGATYVIPMPPQVNTKEDAVAVINYVLNAWGNDGGTVSLEDAKDIKIIR
ncbi:MAG: cytochrome c [Bacteroidales bacterium]|nr:cytochrome c [Bacteroidales bacterium]